MSPRSSQRADRRRRVLQDESRLEESVARPRIFRGDNDGPLCRYNAAALQAVNAPIARYFPVRPYSLVVWFLAGLIPIFGVLLLHQRRFDIAQFTGEHALQAFDMSASGSLAGWLVSVVLAIAVPVMLGIYSIRRHRRDDYRARFAVWQWVMAVALIASIDATVGLRFLFQGACDRLFGELSWGDGSGWWICAWAVVFGLTMVRLLFEMTGSRQAIGWMLAATVCYLWSGLVEGNLGGLSENEFASASQWPILLIGHHSLLFSLMNYARHVVREAMGLVEAPVKTKAKPKTKQKAELKKAKTSSATKRSKTITTPTAETPLKKKALPVVQEEDYDDYVNEEQYDDFEEEEVGTRSTKKKAKSKAKGSAEAKTMKVVSDEGEQEVDLSKLSKSERRRLKREQRRNKKAA